MTVPHVYLNILNFAVARLEVVRELLHLVSENRGVGELIERPGDRSMSAALSFHEKPDEVHEVFHVMCRRWVEASVFKGARRVEESEAAKSFENHLFCANTGIWTSIMSLWNIQHILNKSNKRLQTSLEVRKLERAFGSSVRWTQGLPTTASLFIPLPLSSLIALPRIHFPLPRRR